MSNKDFQNGFALGLVSGGTVEPTTALKANSSVEIIEPININNNNNIVVGSRVVATANAIIKE